MATYIELRNIMDNGDLLNKAEVALLNTGRGLALLEATDAGDRQLINKVMINPSEYSARVVRWLVLKNQTQSAAQIVALSDADIQDAANEVAAQLKAAYVPEVAA